MSRFIFQIIFLFNILIVNTNPQLKQLIQKSNYILNKTNYDNLQSSTPSYFSSSIDYENFIFNTLRNLIIYSIGGDDSFILDLNLTSQCFSQLKNSFFQY